MSRSVQNSPQSTGAIRGGHAAEIAASVEEAIRNGDLHAGQSVPTVRQLAETLGLSPTTTAAAYRELKRRGLLVTEGRRGTKVSPAPPVASAQTAPVPKGALDLASGNPDPRLLPRLGPFLAKMDPEPHLYAEAIHLPKLVEAGRERMRADGVPDGEISVVSGALDGIERVLLAHLRTGDRVAVEDPGYGGIYHLLRAAGHPLEPVGLDDRGPLPDALEVALKRGARAFVLTPRAHNPTGAAVDAKRAEELAGVLERYPTTLLIEDDHAADVSGVPLVTLCRPDRGPYAIVRSVSKGLGPDLRLALLTGDPETVARVEGRLMLGTRWVSHLLQQLVFQLWKDRGVTRAVAEAEQLYSQRRSALIGALARRGIQAQGRSGLNVWVPVPEETPAVLRLGAAGYAVRAGEYYRIQSAPAIRITTAALPTEDADAVADLIATAAAPGQRTTTA